MMNHLNVFLSSTTEDLGQDRTIIDEALRQLELTSSHMSLWGSRAISPLVLCEEEIEKCDLFIGIYGFRYGYVPNNSNKSITEQEFDYAQKKGIPCLCYFAEPSSENIVDEEPWKRSRLEKFKKNIESSLVRCLFKSQTDLKSAILRDLHLFLSGRPLGITINRFRNNWIEFERESTIRLQETILGAHPDVYEGQKIRNLWEEFIKEDPWHERISYTIEKLKEETKPFETLSSYVAEFHDVDCGKDYVYITGYLRRKIPKRFLPEVTKLLRELRQE